MFSPPSNLPVVSLPNHVPLTPIGPGKAFSQIGSGTSFQTPEWDNFTNTPTYDLNRSFWESRKFNDTDPAFLEYRQPKIPIVDTSCSDIESESSTIMTEAKGAGSQISGVDQINDDTLMQQVIKSLKKDINKLSVLMLSFTVANVNEATICSVEPRLKEIRDLHVDIWTRVNDFMVDYESQLGEPDILKMRAEITDRNNMVNNHETEIRTKVLQLNSLKSLAPATEPPILAPSSHDKELLEAQKVTAETQKKLMELEIARHDREIKESAAKVNTKAAEFRSKVKILEDLIKLVNMRENTDFWSETDDDLIMDTMKELEKWDRCLSTAEQSFIEFEQLVNVYGEPDGSAERGHDLASLKELLLALRTDFKDAKDAIIKQDKDRGLYSLSKTTAEVLKYPTFSGEPGQDLIKFKEKMLYRFKRNQVCKIDQIEKLRENLKGKALRLVPDSMKDIETAWTALHEAFGDPSRVLHFRLNSLRKLGDLPAETVKGVPNFESRVEYLLKFENIVEDIIELGKSDDDLYLLAFNANTIAEVVNKFPNNLVLKLNKVTGKGKDRLINIHAKIKEFRADAQSLQKTRSLISSSTLPQVQNKPKPDKNNSAQVMHNPPRRDANCRVCCHLRDVAGVPPVANTVFYEDHISNYVTGCPQFIDMDMSARFKLASEIKLCHRCFHPDVTYSKEHDKQCSVLIDKKHSFSCTKCKMHSWICKYHKQDNKAKLDKFKKEYREKHKLRLVFAASVPESFQSVIIPDNVDSAPHSEVEPTVISQEAPPLVNECG